MMMTVPSITKVIINIFLQPGTGISTENNPLKWMRGEEMKAIGAAMNNGRRDHQRIQLLVILLPSFVVRAKIEWVIM